jgi:hypothetical protein
LLFLFALSHHVMWHAYLPKAAIYCEI